MFLSVNGPSNDDYPCVVIAPTIITRELTQQKKYLNLIQVSTLSLTHASKIALWIQEVLLVAMRRIRINKKFQNTSALCNNNSSNFCVKTRSIQHSMSKRRIKSNHPRKKHLLHLTITRKRKFKSYEKNFSTDKQVI